MKKNVIIIGALLLLASCSNKQQAGDAQANVEAAQMQVDSIQTVITIAAAKLDSVQNATYATPEEKEAAIAEAQTLVDGAKSALENAEQKYEAAKQTFKDVMGKDFVVVADTTAEALVHAAGAALNGEATNAEQDVQNVGDAAKSAAEQTVSDAKTAVKTTVDNAKTSASEAAQSKVDAAKQSANDKVNSAATKANNAINKAQEDANKSVSDGLNKLIK